MATHSSTLAWKIPWMKEPRRLQSMGSQRVGHDWATTRLFGWLFVLDISIIQDMSGCLYSPRCQWLIQASQVALVVKNPPANAGDARDAGSIPGLGRSRGEGNGNPLQFSCLKIPWTGSLVGYSLWGSQRVRHDRTHSTIINNTEHLFMGLLAICISSFVKYLFHFTK